MKQSCKTCTWAHWERHASGRIKSQRSGHCRYPATIWPAMPICQRIPTQDRIGIWPNDGQNCACYKSASPPKAP